MAKEEVHKIVITCDLRSIKSFVRLFKNISFVPSALREDYMKRGMAQIVRLMDTFGGPSLRKVLMFKTLSLRYKGIKSWWLLPWLLLWTASWILTCMKKMMNWVGTYCIPSMRQRAIPRTLRAVLCSFGTPTLVSTPYKAMWRTVFSPLLRHPRRSLLRWRALYTAFCT